MDIIDIVLGGKRGGSSGGPVMTDDVLLNDYGLHSIEMMVAMSGGSLTIEKEQYPVDQFWGLITPWMPPALLLVSELLDPGQKIYTYPTSIGCDADGKPIWLSTQLTLLQGNQVLTVTINLSKEDEGMYVVVTVSKTAIPA